MQSYEELVDPNRPGRRRMKKFSGPPASGESAVTLTNAFRVFTAITFAIACVAVGFGVAAYVRDNQSVLNNIMVDNLRAVNATIDATNITLVKSDSVMASTIMSENGTVTNLESDSAEITEITSTTGTIATLESGEATVTQLDATNGTVTTLSSDNATVTTLASTDSSITNLLTTMQTQEHLEYTASGALQATHNVHILNGASALDMTLPADLTPLIGKHLKICSVGGQEDSVTLLGGANTFDAAGFWQVVRFEGGSPCCVDLHVLSASSVHVISNTCTLFCATPAMNHCIDPQRPEQTNAFHGYWRAQTKAPYDLSVLNGAFFGLVHIDMTQNPPLQKIWAGSTNYPREVTFQDISANPLTRTVERSLFAFSANTLTTIEVDSLVDFPDFPYAFTLQPTQDEAVYYLSRETLGYNLMDSNSLWRRIPTPPQVVPYDLGRFLTQSRSADDPRSILEAYVDTTIYSLGGYTSRELEYESYIGTPAAMALKDDLVNVGFQHTTLVSRIFRTQNASDGITTLTTDVEHNVMPSTRVTINGCTGAWAVMNGDHLTSPAETFSVLSAEPAFADFSAAPANRTQQYRVGFFFDSSALPADGSGVATSTGPCEISVSYGPLKSDTEYLETMSAIQYYMFKASPNAYHIIPFLERSTAGSGPSVPILETWQQVIDANAAGTANRLGQRTKPFSSPSSFYPGGLPFAWLYNADSIDSGLTSYISINNRFGIKPGEGIFTDGVASPFWYSTARQNYLVDVKVPYHQCVGASRTSPDNLFAAFLYGEPGCDSFETVMVDYDVLPPINAHFVTTFAPYNGQSPFGVDYATLSAEELDALRNQFFVGRIDPTYTSGRNIGYARLSSLFLIDPFYFSLQAEFIPDGIPTSVRDPREALLKIYSGVYEYLFTDLGCESIIFDIRGLGGGDLAATISHREFFGTDTQEIFLYDMKALTDDGTGARVNASTWTYANDFLSNRAHISTVFPTQTETNYPGSTLAGGEVIILTNTMATSAGDTFPNQFLGAALDRELGGGTNVQLIGSIDGRLPGLSCPANSLAISQDSARVRDPAGNPRGFRFDSDCDNVLLRAADGSALCNRIPALAVDCAPTLNGLSGGCPLPDDEDTLFFPDLGYVPNTRPRLTGDVRPQTPTPSNRTQWRDAWLEQAVRAALLAKKRSSPKLKPKRTNATPRAQRSFGHACPDNVELRALNSVNGTIVIQFHKNRNDKSNLAAILSAKKQGSSIMRREMETGGLCVNGDGHIMVTPTCQGLPKLVIS